MEKRGQMDKKSKGTGYGTYDPLYPNGIMTAGKDGDLFGIRFLAAGKDCLLYTSRCV